ncbi:hypothetical protein [Tangfeifania diversioriginum]|uniref:hypothetical protein n=1 Tax=Tangfeifania diversioriginum TaxID=1168035 RepID=UPI000934B97E|nr:hypothetical protein [Tangfeifania diversioriginum]
MGQICASEGSSRFLIIGGAGSIGQAVSKEIFKSKLRKAIQTVFDIRNATPRGLKGDYHPLAGLPLAKHPCEANK